MGRLKNGLLLGSVLGAGLMWLNTTKQGRTMRKKIVDQATEVYGDVKAQIVASDAWGTLSKSKYLAMVKQAVDGYIKKYPLAAQAKDVLVKIVSSQWENIQSQIERRKSGMKRPEPRQSLRSTRPKRTR